MSALLWMPAGAIVLFAMWVLAEHVVVAGAEWEQVQVSAWSSRRTAGEDAAGLLPDPKPGPFPAASTLPGCSCPGCECARLLEMDGGQP
jgi:hypothetical protein